MTSRFASSSAFAFFSSAFASAFAFFSSAFAVALASARSCFLAFSLASASSRAAADWEATVPGFALPS